MPPVRRSQKEIHEIHRGKGLEVRLSWAKALSTIEVTVRISSVKFPEETIDGDTTSTILPCDWRRGKYSPVPRTRNSANKTFGPSDLTSPYSEGIWWLRASNPSLPVRSPML
ncbi:hypothetical protein TNCV_1460071 [Trichonephila clavipes]|nr:hypothetical protein TNCV_1460071 [Trichonephila clavipes]